MTERQTQAFDQVCFVIVDRFRQISGIHAEILAAMESLYRVVHPDAPALSDTVSPPRPVLRMVPPCSTSHNVTQTTDDEPEPCA